MNLKRSLSIATVVVTTALTPLAAPTPPTPPDLDIQLNPVVIAGCNVGLGDVVIGTYDVPGLGPVDLACGDAGYGYVHIRKRHESQWQDLVNALGGGVWDDFMEYTLRAVLAAPAVAVYQGDGKQCFSGPIEIFRTDGTYQRTIWPTIVVSENNRVVITAIPSTTTHAC